MSVPNTELAQARMQRVEEHVRFENQHDLEGIMSTFGEDANYDDEPWGEHHRGRDEVRGYYEVLLSAAPDLSIEVHRRHAAGDAVVLECTISGTHLGEWRGLPATGRRIEFPLCAVYTFHGDLLAGERIYYDRASVLHQLGVFREPDTPLGQVMTAVAHPLTMGRALGRKVRQRLDRRRAGRTGG